MKVHLCMPIRDRVSSATFRWVSTSLTRSELISDYSDVNGCCYVDIARAELLEAFFKGKSDALLFIDDDVWSPVAGAVILKTMIDADLPIIAMPYIKRHSNELCLERREGEKPFERNGAKAMAINWCGLGMTLIHREALSTMARRFPELSQKSIRGDYLVSNLFLPEIVNGEYLGDDRNFFRRARIASLGVYTILGVPITHDGSTSCVTE